MSSAPTTEEYKNSLIHPSRATILFMKLACCIVAAGDGTRLGDEWKSTPKALVPILGRPMLYYSLVAFDGIVDPGESGGVEQFSIAVPPDRIDDFKGLVKAWGFPQIVHVVPGGKTRSESVVNALRAFDDDPPESVMIHDCARACVTSEMIRNLIDQTPEGCGGTLAHPASDTLRVNESDQISGEVDRSKIACIETPQLFPYAKLVELHKGAAGDVPTDDTTIFSRAGEKVQLVYHDGINIKVTFEEDIYACEGILDSRGWQDASEEDED